MTDATPFDPPPTAPIDHDKARIRPAGTLALLRFDGRGGPRLLMGRRRADLAFMPGRWVFPGGRVDAADANAPVVRALREVVAERLDAASPHAAEPAAIAAVRETFEETGLCAAGFGAGGLDLAPLVALARAVTPPGRPRRFDARFFLGEASRVCEESAPLRAGDDLDDASWLTLEEARTRPLARITQAVLAEIEARLASADPFEDAPIPSFEETGGRPSARRL